MASVHRRKRPDGTYQKRWSYWYVDHSGKRQTGTGTPDKTTTKAIADKLEAEAKLVRAGLKDPRDLTAEKAGREPIAAHVAAYRQALLDKGGTEKHADQVAGVLTRLLADAGVSRLPELSQEAVQRTLAGRLAKKSRRTVNHALGALKAFVRDCDRRGAIVSIPRWLVALKPYNEAVDQRRVRRALTAGELARLLEATEAGEPLPFYGPTKSKHSVRHITGPERAALYRMASATGLRANELRTLTAEALRLDGDDPTVIVRASYSKHRREDVQPLRRSDAEWLSGYAATREGQALLTVPEKTAKMLRHDLAAAGIPFKTSDGVVDFHALRATYITLLVQSGVDPKRVQTLARHSTITLTMDKYCKTRAEDIRDALEKGGKP